MAVANDKGANWCVSTHVGRNKDEVGTFLMKIEDIKDKIASAKPGEKIEGGTMECGDMDFKMKVYPNGPDADSVGNLSAELSVKYRGTRQMKSVEFLIAENSNGAFLKTMTILIRKTTKFRKHILVGLPHKKVLSKGNSSFFPNGVFTVTVNVKIEGEETVTNTTLPDESITTSQLKGELSDHFRKLLESHQLTDFHIICQGVIIPCHRNILAARSEVFDAMMEHNMMEAEKGEVVINDFDLETVKAMILHIYTGEAKYTEDNAEQLIRTADKYQLYGLKKKIEDGLIKEVKVENAINMFVLGDAVHADKLRDVSKKVIVRNAVAIVKIDGWKEALGRFPDLAMEIFESVVSSKDNNKY